jgi:hypothetical protein
MAVVGTVPLTKGTELLQLNGAWSLAPEPPICIVEGNDMNTDSPMPNAGNQLDSSSQPAHQEGKCYVESAPLAEVMFDQLEYLVAHSTLRALGECPPECVECGRLQQVRNWLLLPFHSSPCRS